MKKTISLLCVLFFLSGCTQVSDSEQEFNDSGQAKAIEREEDLWQHYEDENTGLSFKYPHSVSLEDEEGKMKLSVTVEPVDSLEGTMGYNEETALKNLESLQQGDYGESVDFPLEASKQVVSVGDTYAQQFMVLGRFEVCSVMLERKLYFFHNNNQIVITLYGSKEDIVGSSSEFFTTNPENCAEELIWDFEKQTDFYSLLENGSGSVAAQEWFDTFERIVNTVDLGTSLDVVQSQLLGTWVSTDDERYWMVFSDDMKIDFYNNEDKLTHSYILEEAADGTQIIAGEGDDKVIYAIMELSEDELQLLHLPRGNVLKFKR
ncbi:hypothetical protein KKF55_06595 [Patescibacteria group bacterium]|nr:hypothetical protein [Patescibacteria group bacterium]